MLDATAPDIDIPVVINSDYEKSPQEPEELPKLMLLDEDTNKLVPVTPNRVFAQHEYTHHVIIDNPNHQEEAQP